MMTIDQQVPDSSAPGSMFAARLADVPVTTDEKLWLADTDRNGHITNTVFAVCCQNARMGLSLRSSSTADPLQHPAKLVPEFRVEMHWPRAVEIGTSVERVGRSFTTLSQARFVHDRCVAIVEPVVALMSTATRQFMALPAETAEALRAIARSNCHWVTTAEAAAGAARR